MLESDVVSSLAGNHGEAYDWRTHPSPAFRIATSDIEVRATPQRLRTLLVQGYRVDS